MITSYVILGIIGVAVLAFQQMIAGKLAKNPKSQVFFEIAGIAEGIVKSVDQLNKAPENETEEEKKARQEKMKLEAMRAIKAIAQELGLPEVSDAIISRAIEGSVWSLKQIKKMREQK